MMTRSQINTFAAESRRIARKLAAARTHRERVPIVHAWAAAMKSSLRNNASHITMCGEEYAMHYYKFHVGDYRRDTAHLSLLEHGVYRQLLDWYFLDETPIPRETESVFRRLSARTDDEKKAVLAVLNDFFALTDAGYVQERAEREIITYQKQAENARENGRKGGRPRKDAGEKTKKNQSVTLGNPELTETKANHKPLTNNQYIHSGSRFDDFWEAYPSTRRRVAKAECVKRWKARRLDNVADTIIAHVIAMAKTKAWQDGYEPAPLTYLNQSRWTDGLPEQSAAPSSIDNAFEVAI